MTATLRLLANEPTLVAQAKRHPPEFGPLYDHYYPLVERYVRYRLASRDAVDDVVAHIFEQALSKLADYQPERGPFGPWLFGIARNAVSNYQRQQRRRRWLTLDFLHHQRAETAMPEQDVLVSEQHRALLHAVSQLSARERELIALKFGAQLSNQQIAALLKLSANHVAVIIYRALKRLRALLAEEHHDVR